MPFAHSANSRGERHDLVTHLFAVASQTAHHAKSFGAGELGYYLGLWHDLGKLSEGFQRYLLDAEKGNKRPRGPDHKAAGALLASELLGPLALPLQGHHGGLSTPAELKAWLEERGTDARNILQLAEDQVPDLRPATALRPPDHVRDKLAAELFIRLLFSALVDADYLDTERHFAPDSGVSRGHVLSMEALWRRFAADQARRSGQNQDTVNRARHTIYQACLASAERPPGIYRLTAPTGGGKTRSALAFALRHAMRHGMERIIVAVPYLSITEQTAAVYRGILEIDGEPVVLEHHSGATAWEDEGVRAEWNRLGAENWDAPVIVTTTVQLFDSLFSNRPQAARKVHRLANAVIILDEAQTLPPRYLEPILDVLQRLPGYNTTVVLSTATQPAFEAIPSFRALQAPEIVPEPEIHFRALERVAYEWRLAQRISWDEVAAEMLTQKQCMTIVNTRRDAQTLFAALKAADPDALHLSAAMCGLHKRRVLAEVRSRLQAGQRCRLVSTQVVEAGVDLDLPLVLRALGPLDSMIQAAGRCNREGKLARGRVVIFDPEEGRLPPGYYRAATDLARATLGGGIDPNSPEAAHAYFRRLYSTVETDGEAIQECRKRFDYPETARRFRLIDDASVSVVVTYGSDEEVMELEQAIEGLVNLRGSPRTHWRVLQPYTVSLPRRQLERAQERGLAAEVAPGLLRWYGVYDAETGLSMDPERGETYVY